MPSINLIKASDGTGNASTATVQTVRNSGVTTIIVDTVNNIPATFMGSMGTPHTFVDPVTSEEITVISEATAVDFTGHVSGANLEIDSIAPGYTDLGSAVGDIIVIRPTTDWGNNIATVLAVAHKNDGTLKAGAVTSDNLNLRFGRSYAPGTKKTTSLTYASIEDGPEVSVTIGSSGMALVIVSSQHWSAADDDVYHSFGATGANTIVADDAYATSSKGPLPATSSNVTLLTGLTPGSTTFTSKYRRSAEADWAYFKGRTISVLVL